jgi:hypothetical protein
MKVSGQLHGPTSLPLGNEQSVPTGEEARWALEQVWMLWATEESLSLQEIETLSPGH